MANDRDFHSKYGPRALVAGAAIGLGAEYARQIAARGLDLLLLDREPVALAATADAIRSRHGVDVTTAAIDLARADLVEALRPTLSGVEIGLLVYNAAIGTVAPFLEIDTAQIDAMLDVNCRAPLRLVHALAPGMARRKRGGVILMSSMSGNVGSAQLAVYAATKAFALVLGDALWFELRADGIDVLVVQPGSTRTPGWLASQKPGEAGMPAMEPAEVVREALDAIGSEPCLIPGEMNRQGAQVIAQMPRRQAIELMSDITRKLVRTDRPGGA